MPSDAFLSKLSMTMPDSMLRATGKLNVPIYRLTRGRLMGKVGRAPVLLLTTTGRRSGQKRTAPVVFVRDGERLIVIGSNAGNERTPAWSLNLQANPEADIEIRGERSSVQARVVDGEEREACWRAANAEYAGFDEYAASTARDIKVFVLEPA